MKHFVGDIFNRIPDTRPRLLSSSRIKTRPRSHSKSSVHGIVRRSRSIQVDPAQAKGIVTLIMLLGVTVKIRSFFFIIVMQIFKCYVIPRFYYVMIRNQFLRCYVLKILVFVFNFVG